MELRQAQEIIGQVVESPQSPRAFTDRQLSEALATVIVRNGLLGPRSDG